MYHFEKETFFFSFFNLERKELGLFEKVTRKFNGSSSKIYIYIYFFFFVFWERFGNLDFLFLLFILFW